MLCAFAPHPVSILRQAHLAPHFVLRLRVEGSAITHAGARPGSARQDGDSSTSLTVPEQRRRERSRTVKWKGGRRMRLNLSTYLLI